MKVSLTYEEARELRRIADHLRVRPREALRRVILITCAALEEEDEEAHRPALPGGEAAGPNQEGGGRRDART
jgi:hypothetical protein